MNNSKLKLIEQILEFLKGTSEVIFTTPTKEPKRRLFITSVVGLK